MQKVSGKEHFRRLYQSGLDEEAHWLSFGAGHKADSIQLLLERNRIVAKNMLELGAGTGAVIQECRRRGLATRYVAVDYSAEAIGLLARSAPAIQTIVADITTPEFSVDGDFDVVVLSHVLEHFEEPDQFLKSLRHLRWRYMVAEVPLEDLLASRLKRLLTGEPPGKEAGHVQFFTAATFQALLVANGLNIIDSRRYVPMSDPETIRFMCRRNQSSSLKYLQTMLTSFYMPRFAHLLWSRVYYAHYAVLCTGRGQEHS